MNREEFLKQDRYRVIVAYGVMEGDVSILDGSKYLIDYFKKHNLSSKDAFPWSEHRLPGVYMWTGIMELEIDFFTRDGPPVGSKLVGVLKRMSPDDAARVQDVHYVPVERDKSEFAKECDKVREKRRGMLDALSQRGSDRIEGGSLPLHAYTSDDPADDPRGPLSERCPDDDNLS